MNPREEFYESLGRWMAWFLLGLMAGVAVGFLGGPPWAQLATAIIVYFVARYR